jgi:phospholipid/cholesterol/gamma-HCH transport system permease protein
MLVETLGKKSTDWIEGLGDYTRFFGQIIYWILRGPGKFARQQLMIQAYEIGTLSMPVVAVTGAFIGMVLAIEMYPEFRAFAMEARIGGVINISVVKQIGPVLTAVMLAGRVGGALTAELGTMNVTEQLDALRAMASDPIRILATPRVVACLLMMPALTVASDLLGIGGGYFMAVGVLHVDPGDYWVYSLHAMDLYSIFTGILKSVFFGLAISSIGCFKGFHCGSGAQGVGRACTESFVASFVAILVMNFFLAKLLNDIYNMIWPNVENFFG